MWFCEGSRMVGEVGGIASEAVWVKFQCHVVIIDFRYGFFDNRFSFPWFSFFFFLTRRVREEHKERKEDLELLGGVIRCRASFIML